MRISAFTSLLAVLLLALCLTELSVSAAPLFGIGKPKKTTARIPPSKSTPIVKPPPTLAPTPSTPRVTSPATLPVTSIQVVRSSAVVSSGFSTIRTSSLVSSAPISSVVVSSIRSSASAIVSASHASSIVSSAIASASVPVSINGTVSSAASVANPSASAASNATFCTLSPRPATSGKTRRLSSFFSDLGSLFRRGDHDPEFVGYHGTNGVNAQVYMTGGTNGIPQPPGFNGADGEIGAGLYVSDSINVAEFYARTAANAKASQGAAAATPFICVVMASEQLNWRNIVKKVWIPVPSIATLVQGRNDLAKLAQQEQLIRQAGFTPATTVRFSVLDKDQPNNPRSGNQLMLPTGIQTQLFIKQCAPLAKDAPGNPGASIKSLLQTFGTPDFESTPKFSYIDQKGPWNIVSPTAGTC